ADEFNHNFLNYSPGVILINNIEMDHPEFFKDETEFHEAFIKFIKRIQPPKILVVNEESKGIQKVLKQNQNWLSKNKVKVIGFFLNQRFDFPFTNEYQGTIVKQTIDGSEFIASGLFGQETFMVKVPGVHQVVNALGVIAVVSEMKVKPTKIKKALADFQNLGRRFDLIGETKGIKVYDDYAVHPTAVEAALKASRQKYPKQKIWAVFEPHQYSRLKLFLNDFAKTLKLADQIIITAIYPGREKKDPSIKAEDLVKKIGNQAEYLGDFEEVAEKIKEKAQKGDVVIVFGAGKSYQLSRQILQELND
ncbi:Mur ligase family protein, partial [Patescibacteria group bacterium]|nr:Mur ligase family protein [Patescibacteria group bacterium]